MSLRVEGLKKRFHTRGEEARAVQGVSFEVPTGSFFVLVGPSGCGKSTTMRMLAGLERPDEGTIVMADKVVASPATGVFVPPNRRSIGMVFQSYAIWPHMTVAGNVGYPLKVKRVDKREIASRVEEALEVVGLEGLGQRSATKLSGGQQQRVALARALVARPDVLLLDEPLSNLDAKLRTQMRTELKRIQSALGVTTVYVTHDQTEALSMADELAVMSKGFVMQSGAPDQIYHRPRNRFAASFIGSSNLFPVTQPLTHVREGANPVETPVGPLVACSDEADHVARGQYEICIRPQRIDVSPWDQSASRSGVQNVLRGTVERWVFIGDECDGEVRVGKELVQVKGPSDAAAHMPVGTEVALRIPVEHCRLMTDQPEGADLSVEAEVEARLSA
jgi:iron(III) transport system ATP-binding protein